MKKFSDWWDGLKHSTQKLIIKLLIPAIFIIMSIPFIAWAIMMPNAPFWLSELAWIFPTVIFGIGFLAVVSYLIYEVVNQFKK